MAGKQLTTREQDAVKQLNSIKLAAAAAARRMQALENYAETIHARTVQSCTARLVSTKENGIHALITDANGVTVEIAGGALAVAVAKNSE